jgi:hypothetical protein
MADARRALHRLRRVAAAILVAMTCSLLLAVPARAAEVPARAMWVWTFDDPGAVVSLATERGVRQLFVAVPPNVTTSPQLPAIRALVSAAGAGGIRVDALGGDPGWVDNPRWVVDNWLAPAVATGLFTGIHVDAEPWTTSAWNTNRSRTVSKYLSLVDALRSASGGRQLEVDIPFWFHQVPAGKSSTLDREVMRRSSGVTVMAYRNTAAGPDGTLDVAASQLASGAALGKPVRLGQETRYLGSDPIDVKQTFFGQTLTRMDDQLAQVDAGASAYATYVGIAVHDYTGYAAMAP